MRGQGSLDMAVLVACPDHARIEYISTNENVVTIETGALKAPGFFIKVLLVWPLKLEMSTQGWRGDFSFLVAGTFRGVHIVSTFSLQFYRNANRKEIVKGQRTYLLIVNESQGDDHEGDADAELEEILKAIEEVYARRGVTNAISLTRYENEVPDNSWPILGKNDGRMSPGDQSNYI